MEGAVGLGCMRLSELLADDAIAVIHAAMDHDIRWLDTADVYGPTAEDVGHNERLIAAALASWAGETTARISTSPEEVAWRIWSGCRAVSCRWLGRRGPPILTGTSNSVTVLTVTEASCAAISTWERWG